MLTLCQSWCRFAARVVSRFLWHRLQLKDMGPRDLVAIQRLLVLARLPETALPVPNTIFVKRKRRNA